MTRRDDNRRRMCVREVQRREESRSSVILASTRHARLEHCRQLHLEVQPRGIKPLLPGIRPGRCSREGEEAPPEECSAEPGGNAARQEPAFPCCQFVIVSYLLLVSTSCSEPRLETLGQIAATQSTTSTVPMPPPTTEPTVPNSRAARPDSNAPSSLDEAMKMALIAETRPRISSGVSNWTSVWRTTTLTLSSAPVSKSVANER